MKSVPTQDSILIIGPMGVGKSTLATSLAQTLKQPRCCVDDIQWTYLADTNFDHAKVKHLLRTDLEAFRTYTNPYLVNMIEKVLAAHPGHIIDFGAGHTAFDDPAQVKRIAAAFAAYHKVLLLMPSPDEQVCLRSLPGPTQGMRMNPLFISHPLKVQLAKHLIYTQGKNANDVAQETIAWLRTHSNNSDN